VKHVDGDGLEELADDGGIDGAPVRVVRHGKEVDGAIDMVEEIVLAEKEAEVCLPHKEVGRGVGELDRHALEDGDVADDGDEGAVKWVGAPRLRGVEGIGGAGARVWGEPTAVARLVLGLRSVFRLIPRREIMGYCTAPIGLAGTYIYRRHTDYKPWCTGKLPRKPIQIRISQHSPPLGSGGREEWKM
jgi:hypothetical protein